MGARPSHVSELTRVVAISQLSSHQCRQHLVNTEGRIQGELGLIQRLMGRRFGAVDPEIIKQIQGLSIDQLESLGESLFDFTDIGDVVAWLALQGNR